MNLFLSSYELKSIDGSQSRKGYLIKQQNDDGASGYADIFPWPEFGDPKWGEIPRRLSMGLLCPLLEKSLEYSSRDLEARLQKKSLIGDWALQNHYLMSPLGEHSINELMKAFSLGFDRVKIKVARDGHLERNFFDKLPPGLPQKCFRLDANTRLNREDYKFLIDWEDKIEYLEDPFGKPEEWQDKRDWLAFDQPQFSSEKVDCLWQIIKPAKQGRDDIKKERIVFSSYLDHPVGIAHAFSVAQGWGEQKTPYGLASQNHYQKTDFHQALQMDGAKMTINSVNYGIGFDEILSKLEWVELRRMCGLV